MLRDKLRVFVSRISPPLSGRRNEHVYIWKWKLNFIYDRLRFLVTGNPIYNNCLLAMKFVFNLQ